MKDNDAQVEPFLAQFASECKGYSQLPGSYCTDRQIWLVADGQSYTPLVEARPNLSELKTKTEVRQEDDDESATSLLLEFETKTRVKQESDDENCLN